MRSFAASVAALTLAALWCAAPSAEAGCWTELKSAHRLKRLSWKSHAKLAALSNSTEFRAVLDPLLVVRAAGSDGNTRVRNYISGYMRALGWSVLEDPFEESTTVGPVNFTNVVATHNPRVRRQLVLACHFDSKLFTDFEFIGATDSAVPCGMLLHLARLLNTSLWRGSTGEGEDVGLQLVFFDGEEAFKQWTSTDSTYGSRHLAARWQFMPHPLDQERTVLDGVDVLVLLDLIGSGRHQFVSYFQDTATLFEHLAEIESLLRSRHVLPSRLQSFFSTRRTYGGGIEDDHLPFRKRGVRILHLIQSPFPDVWHKASDNVDALDFPAIDELSTILRVFVTQYLHLSV